MFAEGPYGSLTAARRTRHKVLLLAGGIGVTPLRVLFETLPAYRGDLTLIYRAGHELDVVFRHELDAIAKHRGARLYYAIGKRGGPNDPFINERLRKLLPEIAEHDVYLCGPTPMMEAAKGALRQVGVPLKQIHTESFEF